MFAFGKGPKDNCGSGTNDSQGKKQLYQRVARVRQAAKDGGGIDQVERTFEPEL